MSVAKVASPEMRSGRSGGGFAAGSPGMLEERRAREAENGGRVMRTIKRKFRYFCMKVQAALFDMWQFVAYRAVEKTVYDENGNELFSYVEPERRF